MQPYPFDDTVCRERVICFGSAEPVLQCRVRTLSKRRGIKRRRSVHPGGCRFVESARFVSFQLRSRFRLSANRRMSECCPKPQSLQTPACFLPPFRTHTLERPAATAFVHRARYRFFAVSNGRKTVSVRPPATGLAAAFNDSAKNSARQVV